MTTEEAIKFGKEQFLHRDQMLEFLSLAIDALEKRVPQKPVGGAERPEEVGKIGYDFCPTCGEMVTRRYCPNCGTRILWEEEA